MNFQKLIMIIATILLVLALVYFGMAIRNTKFSEQFPPVVDECPDYWTFKGGKHGDNICVNSKHLGNPSCQKEMDFTGGRWSGSTGFCNKKQWANDCKLVWNGVTNSSVKC